jgi:hypothetical protein
MTLTMISNSALQSSARGHAFSRLFRPVFVLVGLLALSSAVFAQQAGEEGQANGRGNRGNRGGNRGNFDPAQIQQQMMDRMREQFGVTDDAEWKLISERIAAINELRTANGGRGGFAGFAGRGGGQGGRGGRGGASANPEQDALRQAIADKLPDAEVKARLARLREVRKANEEKLVKAQEDLRALLDVRQEAVAVMVGLLP